MTHKEWDKGKLFPMQGEVYVIRIEGINVQIS